MTPPPGDLLPGLEPILWRLTHGRAGQARQGDPQSPAGTPTRPTRLNHWVFLPSYRRPRTSGDRMQGQG